MTASSRVALFRAAPFCPTLVPSLGLLSRLFKAMAQHVLGVRQCPTVRQQAGQRLRARVHRKLQDHVVQVGPGLEPMPLRPRDDRAEHRRTRTRLVAPQEHPVLAADGLIPKPTLRHVIVDRQPAILRVPAQRLPLVQRIRHRLRQRRLGQQLRRQSIQLLPEPL